MPNDELHMREAILLARNGIFRVEPNPLVGAVIVKDGEVVGSGCHSTFGGPHAEVAALAEAGGLARGATLYVTLEPCGHRGKTPPCAEAVAAAGISRVVFAAADPNPQTAGKGPEFMSSAGIDVEAGLLESEAHELNPRYEAHLPSGLPWVIAKWAMSLDGKIADSKGAAGAISGEESHRLVHELRGAVDAVAVGVGTVLNDDPDLRPRHGTPTRAPVRLLLDTRFRTPLESCLVRTAAEVPVWIAGSVASAQERAGVLAELGCKVLDVPTTDAGIDLEKLMRALHSDGIRRILLEGGGRVFTSAFAAGVIRQVAAFCAPILLGGAQAPTPMDGPGSRPIGDPLRLDDVRTTQCGQDVLIEGFVSATR